MERGRLAYGGAFGTEPSRPNFYSDMVQSNRAINDYLALWRNAYWWVHLIWLAVIRFGYGLALTRIR